MPSVRHVVRSRREAERGIVAAVVALAAEAQVAAQITWVQNPANGHHSAVSAQLSWSEAELAGQS